MATLSPAALPSVDSLYNSIPTYESWSLRDGRDATTGVIAATGQMMCVGIPVRVAGALITNITVKWGTTGQATPTHWWFALYDWQATPAIVGQTADQAAAAIGVSATSTLPIAGGPKTLGPAGIYYGTFCVVSGAQPTVLAALAATASYSVPPLATQKRPNFAAGTGLTDTAPPTITGALTSTVTIPYVALT